MRKGSNHIHDDKYCRYDDIRIERTKMYHFWKWKIWSSIELERVLIFTDIHELEQ